MSEYEGDAMKSTTEIDIEYGNTRRQLDRQNEVIDYLAKSVHILETRLNAILKSPSPMTSPGEQETPYLPQLPMHIYEHTNRLDEITKMVLDITDRIDL